MNKSSSPKKQRLSVKSLVCAGIIFTLLFVIQGNPLTVTDAEYVPTPKLCSSLIISLFLSSVCLAILVSLLVKKIKPKKVSLRGRESNVSASVENSTRPQKVVDGKHPGETESTTVGIGTDVIKLFQQIKENISEESTLTLGYRHLLDLACEHLNFNAGVIFIIDHNGCISLRGYSGLIPDSQESYTLEATGTISELFERNLPRYIEDISSIPGNCQELFHSFKAAWLLPLMPQDLPVGLLIFFHKDFPEQREEYYPKLDFVNIAACWFYENHRNHRMVAYENKKNEMLIKTSLAISSSLSLDEVCKILAADLGRSFGCSYSYVLLSRGRQKEMYIQQYYSERKAPIFTPEERIIDIKNMVWLKEIITLEVPVLLGGEEIKNYPDKDKNILKISDSASVLIAPLKHAGRLTGILFLVEQRSAERARMGKEVLDLCTALVAQASAAIENARLYSSLEDKVAQLTTMVDVGQALNSDLALIPFFERVLSGISRNFKISNCAILLRDFEKDELYIASIIGHYQEDVFSKRFKIGKEGITGRAADLKKTINVGDVSKDSMFIPSTGDTGSEMAVPVVLNGKVVGVLDVESRDKFAFSKREEILLRSLMNQVAVAMEKIELKQLDKDRAKKLSLTNALVKKLSGSFDQVELLGNSVRGLTEGFGFDLAAVFILKEDGNLKLAQQSCRSGQGFEPGSSFKKGQGLLSKVLMQKSSCYITKISNDDPTVSIKGANSRYCIPLIAGDRLYGILDVQDKRPRAFTRNDLYTLQTFAEFLAVALNNISLYRETIDKAERLSLVNQINRTVSATLDIEELFNRTVDSLSEVTGYYCMALVLEKQQKYIIKSSYFSRNKNWKLSGLENLEGYFDKALTHGEPIYLSIDEMDLTGKLRESLQKQGISFIAIFPMKRKNRIHATLIVATPEPEGFSLQDYRLLSDVSRHLEIALSNAILYSEVKDAYDRLHKTQQQLIQSEKFKALGEVAAGVVHDFKNILTAINGRAQMLMLKKEREGAIPEEMLSKSLEIIEKSSTDGVYILSRINEFTKIKQETKFSAIKLREIIEDTVEMTRSKWEDMQSDKHIRVETEFDGALEIMGNRPEMVEVFSNLIINAVDAVEKNGTIRIETSTGHEHIIIKVSDDGVGMASQTTPRIFDPFFTTKGNLGTGLGLAMVYGIINRHKGEIRVESEPGKGTVFIIKLPRLESTNIGYKTDVLLVESDDNLRNDLSDFLKEMGLYVSIAENYYEANKILTTKSFDLILIDMGLHDREDWQEIDFAKNACPGALIVPMIGWDIDLDRKKLTSMGLLDVLQKPLDWHQLQSLIEKFSKRKVNAINTS
jgi:signal transduction histidine kinase/CheY-like chemotaxis protein